ncbi:MAG: phosphoribosyl-AMP cyclohydrolase [Phycisphaerae bacterium SM23_30]|nr:MAG: phosphoribosyl-AMP cyclohydrolase [Phycisphaerae bacterium SM23_30]
MPDSQKIETTIEFTPKFDAQGLIPAIAQDAQTGQILMIAFMNDQALAQTLASGNAVYYSRSRQKLWKKGEQSGHVQKVKEILIDCDQDCLVLKVEVNAGQCHTGYQSCFYRRLKPGSADRLEFIASPVFDPKKVYQQR